VKEAKEEEEDEKKEKKEKIEKLETKEKEPAEEVKTGDKAIKVKGGDDLETSSREKSKSRDRKDDNYEI